MEKQLVHMFILLPIAQIVNDASPYTNKLGVIVHSCRVQFMGGEIRCSNPSKIPNGAVKDARISILLRDSAKTYTSKDTKAVGALISKEVQFLELAGVSK